MSSRRRIALLLPLLLAACEGSETGTLAAPTAAAHDFTASSGPKLIRCPTRESDSATGTVGPLGGAVSVAGNGIRIPGGALLTRTVIRVTQPASRFVEIEIRAGGAKHFRFERPVLVTISYARCHRRNLDHPLHAWYIDADTHELIEDMGGVDDPVARTVSFLTTHLSGYAIAE